ncbi:hypothetical protein BC830DRAFT_1083614 [Chytriomyces sp. MP71]|nr:hypothetical protein BC830DRAFT_1083614 [Chytriomyces sp. MP71]
MTPSRMSMLLKDLDATLLEFGDDGELWCDREGCSDVSLKLPPAERPEVPAVPLPLAGKSAIINRPSAQAAEEDDDGFDILSQYDDDAAEEVAAAPLQAAPTPVVPLAPIQTPPPLAAPVSVPAPPPSLQQSFRQQQLPPTPPQHHVRDYQSFHMPPTPTSPQQLSSPTTAFDPNGFRRDSVATTASSYYDRQPSPDEVSFATARSAEANEVSALREQLERAKLELQQQVLANQVLAREAYQQPLSSSLASPITPSIASSELPSVPAKDKSDVASISSQKSSKSTKSTGGGWFGGGRSKSQSKAQTPASEKPASEVKRKKRQPSPCETPTMAPVPRPDQRLNHLLLELDETLNQFPVKEASNEYDDLLSDYSDAAKSLKWTNEAAADSVVELYRAAIGEDSTESVLDAYSENGEPGDDLLDAYSEHGNGAYSLNVAAIPVSLPGSPASQRNSLARPSIASGETSRRYPYAPIISPEMQVKKEAAKAEARRQESAAFLRYRTLPPIPFPDTIQQPQIEVASVQPSPRTEVHARRGSESYRSPSRHSVSSNYSGEVPVTASFVPPASVVDRSRSIASSEGKKKKQSALLQAQMLGGVRGFAPHTLFNLTFPDPRFPSTSTTPVTVAELLTRECITGHLDIATLSSEGDAIVSLERCFFILSPEHKEMAMFVSSNRTEPALDEIWLSQESVLLTSVDSRPEEYTDFLDEYVTSSSDSNFAVRVLDSAIQCNFGQNSNRPSTSFRAFRPTTSRLLSRAKGGASQGVAAHQFRRMQLSQQHLLQDQQSYQPAQPPNQFFRPVCMARLFSDQGASSFQHYYRVSDVNLRRGLEVISEAYSDPTRPPFRNSGASTASSSKNSLLSPVSAGIPGGEIFGKAGELEGVKFVYGNFLKSMEWNLPLINLKAAMAATFL